MLAAYRISATDPPQDSDGNDYGEILAWTITPPFSEEYWASEMPQNVRWYPNRFPYWMPMPNTPAERVGIANPKIERC